MRPLGVKRISVPLSRKSSSSGIAPYSGLGRVIESCVNLLLACNQKTAKISKNAELWRFSIFEYPFEYL